MIGDGTMIGKTQFEEVFEENKESGLKSRIDDFNDLMISIIRFEYRKQGERFRIAGIMDKVAHYERALLEVLEKYISTKVWIDLSAHLQPEQLEAAANEFFDPINTVKLAGVYLDDITERMSLLTIRMIKSYLLLAAFLQNDDRTVYVKDWLQTDFRDSFKRFLLDADIEDADIYIHEQESASSFYRQFVTMFLPEKVDIPIYIRMIDDMIIDSFGFDYNMD